MNFVLILLSATNCYHLHSTVSSSHVLLLLSSLQQLLFNYFGLLYDFYSLAFQFSLSTNHFIIVIFHICFNLSQVKIIKIINFTFVDGWEGEELGWEGEQLEPGRER